MLFQQTIQIMDVNNPTVKVAHRIETLDLIKECSSMFKLEVDTLTLDNMVAINHMMSL
jgi:hypothetical protein